MKLNTLAVLPVLSLGTTAWAWTTSGRTPSRSTQTRLFGLPSDDNQHGSSRRQWLAGMAASTTGVLIGSNHPAVAYDMPASAALCDPTVSAWERNGRVIFLLGTAHISTVSAQLAGQLVHDTHPDAVFIELDLKRIGGSGAMAKQMEASGGQMSISASGDDENAKASRIMISPVGRTTPAVESSSTAVVDGSEAAPPAPVSKPPKSSGGGGGGILNNLGAAAVGKGIRGMYSKLGSEGFNPGEEFMVAIKEGQKQGAAIVLGDQDVDVTLRRMAQAIQKTDLNRLLSPDSELEQGMRDMLPSSGGSSSGMSEKEAFKSEMTTFVETMKTKENVKKIMALMQQEAPALYEVMVSERDAYMAAGLNTLNEFAVITAVMGLAHMDGIERNLQNEGWKAVPLRCPQA